MYSAHVSLLCSWSLRDATKLNQTDQSIISVCIIKSLTLTHDFSTLERKYHQIRKGSLASKKEPSLHKLCVICSYFFKSRLNVINDRSFS